MANFGAAVKNFGAFTEGFMKGQRDQERYAMEKQRAELDLAKAKDEAAMREELKALDTKPHVARTITVTTPDGEVVYGDEKLAQEHMQAAGKDAQMVEAFTAGGQRYESKDEAESAVSAMTTPAAKARRKAEVAEKYARPDVAAMFQANYKKELEASRAEIKETAFDAYRRGDIGAAVSMYNDRLSDGMKAEVQQGEDGSLTITKTKNGKPVGQPATFANADMFWNGTKEAPGFLQNVAATPDNALEQWNKRATLGLQTRQVESQEKVANANVTKINADVANIPVENSLKSRQVGAAETSAGAAATNAGSARMGLTMPKPFNGVNDDGDIVMSATQPVQDPKTKAWSLNVLPQEALPGMAPQRTVGFAPPPKQDALSELLKPPAPLVIDWSKVPAKNLSTLPPTKVPEGRDPRAVRGLITPAR